MVANRQAAGLSAEDELYRLLAENVLDYAIFLLDMQGIVRGWPQGAERILGYTADEIIGQKVDILFTPEDVAAGMPQHEMQRALETGRGEDNRWHLRKNGTRFWAAGVVTPLFDEENQPRGFAKLLRDRTEWKTSEQVRDDIEANRAAVLNTALDGIITIDQHDRILEFNPAAERLFGYQRSEVLGRRMAEIIVPERFRAAHYAGIAKYLATGEGPALDQRLKLPALRADGTEFIAEIAIIRVPLQGDPLFTGYIRDISEQVMQELRQATQLETTGILSEAESIQSAAPRLLPVLCRNAKWDAGIFWLVDSLKIRCASAWSREDLDCSDILENCSRPQDLADCGIPQNVWKRGQAQFVSDLADERDRGGQNSAHWQSAIDAGFQSAFLLPVKLGSELLAVLEFFSRVHEPPETGLIQMLETIGGSLAQFIQRKHAEHAQRLGEERLRRLIDNLPQGAVYRAVHSAEAGALEFTFLSAGVEQIFGYTAEEGMSSGRVIYDQIHEEDRELVLIEEARALETGEQFDLEFRIVKRTGETCWVHCRSAAHELGNGFVAWEGVILDVTDRQEAEAQLRENEDRLRLAFEAGKMGTWNWDLHTNQVHWSPQLEVIHGIPFGTFGGTFEAYQSDMHPEDREKVLASIRRALTGPVDHHLEYRIVLPDSSIRWIEARGKVFRNAAGQPIHMLGVCTEITDRRRREEDLRFLAEASRSLATLVDYESTLQKIAGLAVPHFSDWCSIYLPTESGTLRPLAVSHVNPEKVEFAQEVSRRWPPPMRMPNGIYEVYRTGKSVLVEEITEERLRTAVNNEEHFSALKSLGLKSYMCVPLTVRDHTIGVMTFIAAESGRKYTTADLALAEDLARRAAISSENARLYATLREEARKKDEFLAMLAHELRNPLAPVRSGLDLLKMMGTDAEIVETMQQQIEHLVRLVDDLLDVSRIMRGKIDLRLEHLSLETVVARAVETVRPLIERHQQKLAVDLPSEPIWLEADPVRLTQVIGNLLNNASKYTERNGEIKLSAELASDSVLVQVKDNGIGIPAGLLPQVFDLFTQDQRSVDRSQGGLGIGLTVVKSLVEMHGGNVGVRSEGPGAGSEFWVRLPLTAVRKAQPHEGEQPEFKGQLRILVVDDNLPAARILTLLLKKLGATDVVVAHDGEAALEAARLHQPDLILLDIGLPRMDGLEVVRELRKEPEFQKTTIVALTGYGTAEDRRKSFSAGFDEHLVKPPGLQAIKEILAMTARRSL